MEIIRVGEGAVEYWAELEDGVVVNCFVVAAEPKVYAGVDERFIERLRSRFPDKIYVKLPESPRPGIGWRLDGEEWISPEPEPASEDPQQVTLSKEEYDALVAVARAHLSGNVG